MGHVAISRIVTTPIDFGILMIWKPRPMNNSPERLGRAKYGRLACQAISIQHDETARSFMGDRTRCIHDRRNEDRHRDTNGHSTSRGWFEG
jgi:hypothetical protein